MEELDYQTIGMRIRRIRKMKQWSQETLAKKCGISMSFLGHIERGTRIMSLETFVRLCTVLNAGADELLWGAVNYADAGAQLWKLPNEKGGGKSERADSYSMYVRIMKSVAEIMHEA